MSALLLLLFALFSGNLLAAPPTEAITPYEADLLATLQDIQQLEYDEALDRTRRIIDRYPTSKVGQMLYGDLLLAKAGVLPQVGYGIASRPERNNLTFELKQRLASRDTPARKGYLPANLVQLADNQPWVILMDQSRSRLYIFRNQDGTPVLLKDYFLTIGLKGFGKQKEGDQKTPIGVYHVTSYIDDKVLPDLYGRGAFPVNYPNSWDRRKGRTGSGIWLHGTPSYTYNRAPWASNGCMVVSNPDFIDLKPYVSPERGTPVVIADEVKWISPEQWQQQRKTLLQRLTRWIEDVESNQPARYLSHYSKRDLLADGRDFKAFEGHKRWVNRNKRDIRIGYENLAIYRYPGEKDLVLMEFDQDYRSNILEVAAPKELFWRLDGDDWKIVQEGVRRIEKPDSIVAVEQP